MIVNYDFADILHENLLKSNKSASISEYLIESCSIASKENYTAYLLINISD